MKFVSKAKRYTWTIFNRSPIDVYRQELKAFIPAKLNEITATRRGVTTVYAGLVLDVANFPNRVVIVLDDGTARIEVSCNHERFNALKILFKLSA